MEEFILQNEERKKIFKVLCEQKRITFNRIADLTGMRSNKLSYQLNLMVEKGFLVHEQEQYSLSLEAQRLIPYFSQIFKKEVGVLPVILGIVQHGENVLLIKRKKMPYKGYWSIFGGKQINGETIAEAIEREIKEESLITARFQHCNAVVYERLREKGQFKHSFLFIITTAYADSMDAIEQQEGEVCWFNYEDVIAGRVEKVIPSDIVFMKKYGSQKMDIDHIIMDEEENETLSLR